MDRSRTRTRLTLKMNSIKIKNNTFNRFSSRTHSHSHSHCHKFSSESQNALQPTDLLLLYQNKLSSGILRPDPNQLRTIYKLRSIHKTLQSYVPNPRLISLFDQAYLSPTNPNHSKNLSYKPDPTITSLNPTQRKNELIKVLKQGNDDYLADQTVPIGFLLTGSPGTGKSLIMDLFFESLTTPKKLRRHYHHFLLSLYSLVFNRLESRRIKLNPSSTSTSSDQSFTQHDLPIGTLQPRQDRLRNKALLEGWRSVFAGGSDPSDPVLNGPDFVLAQVAKDLILTQGWILAFDEIQMVDVAGAGILSRVIEWYWRLGGIVLGTSNRVPEHMYDEGVQKSTVLPFLNRLQDKSPTVQLDSLRDWRRELSDESKSTLDLPTSWHIGSQFEHSWSERVRKFLPKEEQTELLIYGRRIEIKRANLTHKSVLMTYKELCEAPLGPADYLLIASTFETILVENVPVFTGLMKNEARRFITFIDACYECQVRLHINAADEIDELFFPDHDPNTTTPAETDPIQAESISELIQDLVSSHRPNTSTYRPSNPLPSFSGGSSSSQTTLAIFTGQDEQYAFQRAVSRLHELTRPGGSGKAWVPMLDTLKSLWKKNDRTNQIPSSDLDSSTTVDHDQQTSNDSRQQRRPIISPNNVWGIGKWGKRAGRWGKGVEVYDPK